MNGDDVSLFAPESERSATRTPETSVEVLILTALKDELDGVLGLGHAWTEARDSDGFPYHRASLPSSSGGEIVVAAAWIGEMGQTAAAVRRQALLRDLEPACLAMCGICAGDPEKVSLGDASIFRRLRRINRDTLALDMEGAAIAELADRAGRDFFVVKSVQDFANGDKDDTFRPFGCRASAEFLLAFLQKRVEPKRAERPRKTRVRARKFDGERERENPFVRRVEQAAALRHPKATMRRHAVDSPYEALLELEIGDGTLSEIKLVAALDTPVTAELVALFATHVEKPFRIRFPLLRSTIVHQGEVASPELRVEAFRKGITLETFREYQGLFDMKPYLEWQTNRLLQSTVYPPAMYVDAEAEWQVSGSREWTPVDNALRYLWELLKSPEQRRFALVLGEFGAGKTFLLRELARRMHLEGHPVWPVLLEMHLLEKRHDLAELLGAHFAKADVRGFNYPAFQYMLSEGRIALLFDGFDELADRVTYDTVTDHFHTVLSAAQGEQAKVLLSSRRQHFLSESQVKLALTEQAQRVPGTLASGADDATVRLWDAAAKREIHVLAGHTHAVRSVAFGPDGRTLASGSEDGTIRLWNVASGQCFAILFATYKGWVAFSPDGRYKCGGNLEGSFWHVVGLCRFELGELDVQLPDDADFRQLPPLAQPIRVLTA